MGDAPRSSGVCGVLIVESTYIVVQNKGLSLIKDSILKRLKVQPVMCSAGQRATPGALWLVGTWVPKFLSASTQPVPTYAYLPPT